MASDPTDTLRDLLRDLLRDPAAPMVAIADLLDNADAEHRRAALHALNRRQQRALYERAATSPLLTLTDLVPATTPPLTAVIHHGKNSLPLFRDFQKHMCRPDDTSARVYGYNEGITRPFIGPGYFVAYQTGAATDGTRDWAARGGVVVDYCQLPQTAVTPRWPPLVANDVGLQRFVFRGMRDFLRRVSTHASIGAAWQGEVEFNSWFILCRDP